MRVLKFKRSEWFSIFNPQSSAKATSQQNTVRSVTGQSLACAHAMVHNAAENRLAVFPNQLFVVNTSSQLHDWWAGIGRNEIFETWLCSLTDKRPPPLWLFTQPDTGGASQQGRMVTASVRDGRGQNRPAQVLITVAAAFSGHGLFLHATFSVFDNLPKRAIVECRNQEVICHARMPIRK